jgi:hypothetical protein
LNCIPNKQSETANLAKHVQLAVGMKYDITANIDVEDGITNGSSCEVKFIWCPTLVNITVVPLTIFLSDIFLSDIHTYLFIIKHNPYNT